MRIELVPAAAIAPVPVTLTPLVAVILPEAPIVNNPDDTVMTPVTKPEPIQFPPVAVKVPAMLPVPLNPVPKKMDPLPVIVALPRTVPVPARVPVELMTTVLGTLVLPIKLRTPSVMKVLPL